MKTISPEKPLDPHIHKSSSWITVLALIPVLLVGVKAMGQPDIPGINHHRSDVMPVEMISSQEQGSERHHSLRGPFLDKSRHNPAQQTHERSSFFKRRKWEKMTFEDPLEKEDLIRMDSYLQKLIEQHSILANELENISRDIGGSMSNSINPAPSPKKVIRSPKIRKMMGKQHRLINEQRNIRKKMGRHLFKIAVNHPQWGHLVEPDGNGINNATSDITLTRWAKAHLYISNGDIRNFVVMFLGKPLGTGIYRRINEALDRQSDMTEPGHPVADDPEWIKGHQHDSQNLGGRLIRLERHIRKLKQVIHRQAREIDRLRSILEGKVPRSTDKIPTVE